MAVCDQKLKKLTGLPKYFLGASREIKELEE